MQKVLGVLMLGVGLAYFVSDDRPPNEREEQQAAITRILARATIIEPVTVPAEQPGLRSPVASPAVGYVVTPAPAAQLPQPGSETAQPAQAQVTAALPAVSIANGTAQRPPASAEASFKVRRELARTIQSELKRVGCYSGQLDGSWGDRSRTAMVNFLARVNASLPTYEPDVFLLSLIKGQRAEVCGAACSTGEILAGGRCVSRNVIADASPAIRDAPSVSPLPSSPYSATIATRSDPLPGRMSIGGPPPAPSAPPAPVTEWTAPASERLPWQSGGQEASPPAAMAALEPGDEIQANEFSTQPSPRKATKVKRSSSAPKPVKRRYSSSRSVQQLFMHPLGRM